jgi:glycosyltransferase involved in cell wall biosynthesis
LIPAHNEEKVIERTVAKLISDVDYPVDLYEVIVIANNCSDSTSYFASFSGARVLERINEWKKGRWHALEWAITNLKKDNFDMFLFLNADSYIEKNALQFLDAEFREGHIAMQLPIQSRNRSYSWANALKTALASPKDYLLPKGRDRIGFSAPLSGNGSCITSKIIEQLPFEIAENGGIYEYYFKLISAGEKVRFICGKKVETVVAGELKYSHLNGSRLKEFIRKLLKESLKGNLTAFESLFNIFIPSIKLIFTSLIVLMFTGGILCLAADLPGLQNLFNYGVIIFLLSAFFIFTLHLYIFIGMIEKKVPLKIWIAATFWPIISIGSFLLGNSDEN